MQMMIMKLYWVFADTSQQWIRAESVYIDCVWDSSYVFISLSDVANQQKDNKVGYTVSRRQVDSGSYAHKS